MGNEFKPISEPIIGKEEAKADTVEEKIKSTVIENIEDPNPIGQPKHGKKIRLIDIVGGKILLRNAMLSQLPILILIVIFAIIMVTNRYYIENTTIDIKRLQKEIDELQIRHVQVKCDYMNATMIMEVTKKLDTIGVKQSTDRPLKIKIVD